jgi:hypothetical protein
MKILLHNLSNSNKMLRRHTIGLLFVLVMLTVTNILSGQKFISSSNSHDNLNTGLPGNSARQLEYAYIAGINENYNIGSHQDYEISLLTGIEDRNMNLLLAIYPDQLKDCLVLKTEDFKNHNFSFLLYDVEGHLLKFRKVESTETRFSLLAQSPGTYFLKVTDGKVKWETFKIIKNQ